MANNVVHGMGFHHIALRCKDFEKSVKFYEAISCVKVAEWGDEIKKIAMVDLGDGGRIELFSGGIEDKVESATQSGEWFHFAIKADDPDVAFSAAIAAGATEKIAPYDTVLKSDPPMHVRLAFVYGPSGEVIEFFKQKD